jgi:anti-anti-sigma factor
MEMVEVPPSTAQAGVFETEQVGDVTLIRFVCPSLLDEAAIQDLAQRLARLLECGGRRRFVMNLGAVTVMASLMLAKLMGFRRKVLAAGGRLALCAVDADLYRVFERTQLTRLFHIFNNEQEAMQTV